MCHTWARRDFAGLLFSSPAFGKVEINCQAKKVICPWLHSRVAAELGLECWSPDCCALNPHARGTRKMSAEVGCRLCQILTLNSHFLHAWCLVVGPCQWSLTISQTWCLCMKTTKKVGGPQLGINYIILQKVAQISPLLGRLLQSFHPEMIAPSSVMPEDSYLYTITILSPAFHVIKVVRINLVLQVECQVSGVRNCYNPCIFSSSFLSPVPCIYFVVIFV